MKALSFNYSSYKVELRGILNDQLLTVEGETWVEYKTLRFTPGNTVNTKFNKKDVKAVIIKFLDSGVKLDINGKQKRVCYQDFLQQNQFTETVLRIEKDGFGPYRSPNPGKDLLAWREKHRIERLTAIGYSLPLNQPTPEEDIYFNQYPLLGRNATFGFKDFNQLFKWFTLEDVLFLKKEGFTVTTKQKGVDYFDTFFSTNQMAMVKDEATFELIKNEERRGFY